MLDVKTNLQSELIVNKLKVNNVNNINEFVLTSSDGNLLNNSSLSIFNNNLKLNPINDILFNSDMILENRTLYYDIDKSTYIDVNNVVTTNTTPTPILILNTSPNTTYIVMFEITANNKLDSKYSSFTAYLNIKQGLINTQPISTEFINYIISSDTEMDNTSLDIVTTNNTFKIVVIGLNNTQIYWKSSVKISSNSGNPNLVNNGSGFVKIESTNIVSAENDFKINFSNTNQAEFKLNAINQNVIKKSLMYNNSVNTSLTELYDSINNKGQILLNNNNILDYTLTEIKSYNKLNLNDNKIINLDTPVNNNDASNKLYTDNILVAAKAYTDTNLITNLNAAKSYTDTKTIKYCLITQNTVITQDLTTTMIKINTTNGSLLTNNYINSTYSIDVTDGTIKINEIGYYDVTVTFDYFMNVYNVLTLSFGINNTNVLRKITNNESNKYMTIQFNTIVNVSSIPYNLSLYFKRLETITSSITIENLTFKILKL